MVPLVFCSRDDGVKKSAEGTTTRKRKRTPRNRRPPNARKSPCRDFGKDAREKTTEKTHAFCKKYEQKNTPKNTIKCGVSLLLMRGCFSRRKTHRVVEFALAFFHGRETSWNDGGKGAAVPRKSAVREKMRKR